MSNAGLEGEAAGLAAWTGQSPSDKVIVAKLARDLALLA
ncbi:hypothetical protein J2S90_001499 [Arthrobacter bambusae]|uniref:Uncharacterized protein n=1 Tax=Arthrobacter bambusae TaxID=1338426 RepID=A0AAW8DHB2_9MICC|nr:hypothetical protein [Arthrobacter bambusae]MDQ0129359.1 hypothetical protein [Arthrobacter bambusae]MDQ0181028.1 hypothetical protein [Arthrobacter bambusae]